MLNPKNIGNTVRMFIGLGSKEVVEQFLEQANLATDGAEFLAVSLIRFPLTNILVRHQVRQPRYGAALPIQGREIRSPTSNG
jgi:hypothetical protein